MIAILTTALFASAAALALFVLYRDSSRLLAKHGEWRSELSRIDRADLRDSAAFTLRPVCDPKRGIPARQIAARHLSAAA